MLVDYSGIAQLVEHLTVNQGVDGSSPPAGVFVYDPLVKWLRQPPFHGGNMGSNPVRVMECQFSSVGRATVS